MNWHIWLLIMVIIGVKADNIQTNIKQEDTNTKSIGNNTIIKIDESNNRISKEKKQISIDEV